MDLLLPQDGSIVIIDDQYSEAKPLMDLFSKNGYPYLYFDGNLGSLPDENLERVRLVFADIQLTPALNEQQYAALLISHLDKLISAENGPYILLVWSGKGNLFLKTLKERLAAPEFTKRPIVTIEIDKTDFFKTETSGGYDIDILKEDFSTRFSNDDIKYIISKFKDAFPGEERKILKVDALRRIGSLVRKELNNYQGFELLVKWEALVFKAATNLTYEFSKIHPTDAHWDFNFRNIVSRLAQAQVGDFLPDLSRELFLKASMKTLNSAFMSYLDAQVLASISITRKQEASYKEAGYAITIDGVEYKIVWRNHKSFEFFKDSNKIGAPHGKIDELKSIGNSSDPGLKEIIKSLIDSYRKVNPELNSKLNIDLHTQSPFQPGVVYEIPLHTETKRSFLSTYFRKNFQEKDNYGNYKIADSEIDKCKFVEIEVSPNCDYANGKWLKHRAISGVIFPAFSDVFKEEKVEKNDSIYGQFPRISLNGDVVGLLMSFKLFKSFDLKKGKRRAKNFLFKIKDQAMADIVTRMASHASRIGLIEFK